MNETGDLEKWNSAPLCHYNDKDYTESTSTKVNKIYFLNKKLCNLNKNKTFLFTQTNAFVAN